MDQDSLERLSRRIESKPGSEPLVRRPLSEKGVRLPREWKISTSARSRLSRFSPLEYVFAGSILFFIGAATITALVFFSGSGTVSTRNVDIVVTGPASIRAGEEVALQVIVTNRNAVPMNLTDLLVVFPPGTRAPDDVSKDLLRLRESIGTIAPQASVNRTIRAIVFGEAGIDVPVEVTAEYRVPSSNAIFQSSETYTSRISQSPASIRIESLGEVISGQPTDLTVTVSSNAAETLTDMLLVARYPPGFSFDSSTPKPARGTQVWDLGDIEPQGSRTIRIRGAFSGEESERVIHFTAGSRQRAAELEIAAPLATQDATLAVARPFLSTVLKINGSAVQTAAVERGTRVTIDIDWINNTSSRLQNVELLVKLEGSVLDRASVRSGRGFYRSADTSILFSRQTDAALAVVEPGEGGTATFEFATARAGAGAFQNPQVSITATVKANRSLEGGVVDSITSSARGVVQVATDLALLPVVRATGGPVPPRVDTETRYAVTWLVQNSANAIADASVSAALPPNVVWKQGDAGLVYTESTRTVTWAVGDMAANAARSVTFEVGLVPTITQVNTSAALVVEQRLAAFDRFIRASVARSADPITTQTGISSQNGTVVP
ncbi:hypothetical protein KGO06_02580 [Patescibacteria group bacterium]|nr:hypothetical protein [Patescibacteria group bacterium]